MMPPVSIFRVLVAEDDRPMAEVMDRYIRAALDRLTSVTLAHSLPEALGWLSMQRFDLVAFDLGLPPVSSGLKTLDAFFGRTGDARLLVVTGSTEPEVLEAIADRGLVLVRKPYRFEAMVDGVRQCLERPDMDEAERIITDMTEAFRGVASRLEALGASIGAAAKWMAQRP